MDDLSAREREVLDELCRGKRNREIAEVLYVGTETIKSHLKTIYRRLGVATRPAASAEAQQLSQR